MANVDVNAVLAVAEPLALDLIALFRRHHAETGQLPTDEEVIAHAKAKAQAIVAEGQQALQDFPDDAGAAGGAPPTT